jgi:hypothetical protein
MPFILVYIMALGFMIPNYDNCIKQLEKLCDLGDNWNGSDAVPISTSSVCNAFLLLEKLPDFDKWFVYPVAYNPGIVQIEFENDKIYIEIECHALEYHIMVQYPDDETFNMVFITIKQTIKYLNRIYS